jgi:hypothetical protein
MPRRGRNTSIQLLNRQLEKELTLQEEPARETINPPMQGGAAKEVKTKKSIPKPKKGKTGPINTRILLTR